MKADLEFTFNNIIQVAKDNISAKIAEIQAEKTSLLGANNFDLKDVDSTAFLDQLDETVANYDPFVYYGISNISVESQQGASASNIEMFIMVCFHNTFEDSNAYKRALRYTRVLREIYEANYKKIKGIDGLKVSEVAPENTKLQDGNGFYKVGGIVLQFTIYNT